MQTFNIRMGRRPGASSTLSGSAESASPLIGVGIGTAGCRRLLKWGKQMGEAGTLERVQSLLFYDFNQQTCAEMRRMTRDWRKSRGTRVIIPEKQRAVDGFLSDPNRWKNEFQGLITQDLEEHIKQLRECSEEVASPPALILVFIGFGGHANLSCYLYRMLKETFGSANFLPILLVPNQPDLYHWLHNQTWDDYEEILAQDNVLITDNAAGEQDELDHYLVTGLASFEAIGSNDLKHGSLPETIGGFSGFSFRRDGSAAGPEHWPDEWTPDQVIEGRANGNEKGIWLGMNVNRTRLTAERHFSLGLPLKPLRLVRGRDDSLTHSIRTAIKDCVTGDKPKLHCNNPPEETVPQTVVVSIPIADKELPDIANGVKRQIEREDWFVNRKGDVDIRYGSANFPDDKTDRLDVPQGNTGFMAKIWSFIWKWRPGLGVGVIVFTILALAGRIFGFPFGMSAADGYLLSGGTGAVVTVGILLRTFGVYRRIAYGPYPDQHYLYVTVASLYPLRGPIRRVVDIRRKQEEDYPVLQTGGLEASAHSNDPTTMGYYYYRDIVQATIRDRNEATAGVGSEHSTNGGVPYEPRDWTNRPDRPPERNQQSDN